MVELKFSMIVERARLSPWTAQYVLKHPEYLPGMPEAGRQGVHRVFSLEQAFRFALCAQLVQAGVPLKDAATVIAYCLTREKELRPSRPDEEFPFTEIGRRVQWFLRIADGTYVELAWRKPDSQKTQSWFSIPDGSTCKEIPVPLTMTEINLSLLVRRIS